METFVISKEKLGFKLDKSELTPTISYITPGGALENILIDKCSSISIGDEIIMINGQSIVGFNYERAMSKIKNCTSRPIELVIKSNKINSPIRKITTEEMNKISEDTTKQALRDLAKSQLEKDNSESSDDNYDKIEEKLRMLEFEKMNMEIELNEEITSIKKVHDPIILINDHILTANKFYDTNYNYFNHSSSDISIKLKKIENHFNNSIKLINQGKKKINYMGHIILIDTYIKKITIDFNRFYNRQKQILIIQKFIEWFQFMSMILVPIIIYTYYYL